MKNTKTTAPTTFFLLTLFFLGIIGLTSCEKEEEIKKAELGEAVSEVKPNEEPTEEEESTNDSTRCRHIEYETRITSNWINQTAPLMRGTDIDFFDENFGVITSMSSVFFTTNGGETWDYKIPPVSATFLKVQTFDVDKFYFSRNGIYKNEGENYSNFGDLDSRTSSIFDFHFFDSANAVISHGHQIRTTNNGGRSWQDKEDILGNKIQFLNNEVGYVSGGYTTGGVAGGIFSFGDIYKTIDRGNTWERLDINPSEITAMYFVDENIGIFADYSGIIHQTTDGGSNWEVISEALCGYYIEDIIFTDQNIGYAVYYEGIIFKTEDGGKTWKVDYYSSHKESLSDLAKTPNNTVYVTGDITMKRIE